MLQRTARLASIATLVVVSCSHSTAAPTAPRTRAEGIDVFVGTAADHGQLDPAASIPFGLVKVGPDTSPGAHGGYDFTATDARGISHTRIGGVGCTGTGGDVRFLPGLGPPPDGRPDPLAIDKKKESAGAGWWSGTWNVPEGGSVHVSVAATAHAAIHEYAFDRGSCRGSACPPPNLYVDVNYPLPLPGSGTWTASPDGRELSGDVTSATVCLKGHYTMHWVASFDPPFLQASARSGAPGAGSNVVLSFAPSVGAVTVKLALSSVDIDGARANLAEAASLDVAGARAAATAAWNDVLSSVEVDGDAEQIRLFDTMLYRSLLTPMDITDADGRYRGTDGAVHHADGFRRYHGWSTWDTYRTKHPLVVLLQPNRAADVARSVVDLFAQGKAMWAGDREPAPTVRADHAGVVLFDSIRKGIDVDLSPGLDAIVAEADVDPPATPDARLEAAQDAWAAIGLLQAAKRDVPASLRARFPAWRDTWTASFRDAGDDADTVGARGLYEGTLWQYRWAPVFDVQGLMTLDGGRGAFADKLDTFFGRELYNHGNEPDLHAAFLYVPAGRPWKTQEWVTRILTGDMRQWYGTHEKWPTPVNGRIYRRAPDGYLIEMDDDDGTMAAWYVLAAMGLYPLAPGVPYYALSRPLFDRVTIHTGRPHEARRDFTIRVDGGGAYVRAATLNGVAIDRAWISHDEVIGGGTLVLATGATPDPTWATSDASMPPSWVP